MEVNSRLMVVVGLMDEFNNRGGVLMLQSARSCNISRLLK